MMAWQDHPVYPRVFWTIRAQQPSPRHVVPVQLPNRMPVVRIVGTHEPGILSVNLSIHSRDRSWLRLGQVRVLRIPVDDDVRQ